MSIKTAWSGDWRMGENKHTHATQVAALRLGIDRSIALIDTTEMWPSWTSAFR